MSTKTIDTIDPIVQRLNVLAKSSPELAKITLVYATILPIVRDANLHPAMISILPEQARAKLENGLPLLREQELTFDDGAAADLMARLASSLETISLEPQRQQRLPWKRNPKSDNTDLPSHRNNGFLRAAAAHQIRFTLDRHELPVSDLLTRVAAGDQVSVKKLAENNQLDPKLLWTLAQNTLKPALREWRKQLTPLAKGIDWQKGYCFICGNVAAFGELQDNDQVKHLRCSQCGADWVFRRMLCMYCGNTDHNTLSHFYLEGQRDKLRIDTCDQCHGYLKVISSFSPTPPDMLPIEDLATMHLDFIAQKRGYARIAIEYEKN